MSIHLSLSQRLETHPIPSQDPQNHVLSTAGITLAEPNEPRRALPAPSSDDDFIAIVRRDENDVSENEQWLIDMIE